MSNGAATPGASAPGGWHADDTLLVRYVRGDADAVAGTSLEQHFVHCAQCRSRMADQVAAEPLEALWGRIRGETQAPSPTLLQRVLQWAHVSDGDALLVATAPSLRGAWLAGMAATLGFTLLAEMYRGRAGLVLFLLVAPLIPVAGVATAHGPDTDPSYEVSGAAPYPAARLLLLRTAAVLATSTPLALVAGLVPGYGRTGVLWLVPALTFTAVVLAASTWTTPVRAATVVAVGWAFAVIVSSQRFEPALVLSPALLSAYVVLGIAAALVLLIRIPRLTLFGSPT